MPPDALTIFTDLDLAAVAARLRQTRLARGLSRNGVAVLADLSYKHYCVLEQEGRDLRLSTLYKLCLVLGCSADTLLGLPALPPDHPAPAPR